MLLVREVSAVYDCAPLFVPSIAVHSRPSRLLWINRSTDLLSSPPLSLSPFADDDFDYPLTRCQPRLGRMRF